MLWISTHSCSRSGRRTTARAGSKLLRVPKADPEKRALRRQVKQLEAKVQARREVRALEQKLAALEVEHDLLKKAIRFNIERRRRSSSS